MMNQSKQSIIRSSVSDERQVHLSVVSPVYMGEKMVQSLVRQVKKHVSALTDAYEIILVEDGSPDNSWSEIRKACCKSQRVKGLKLSRNFGQHYAITAGLEHASGEWVIVMDCDLQDRPDQIPKLYRRAQEGNELVLARRTNRVDSFFKRSSSALFYRTFGFLTDTQQDNRIANFGIYHRRVIRAVLSMKDHVRYFPTMSQWVGFKRAYVDVEHGEREEGASSYNWRRLFKLAWDNMLAFSNKPLMLTIRFGLFIAGISGLIGLFYFIQYLRGEIVVLGYSSLIISIWFLSGIIIMFLGIIGMYIGKIFDKVKDRPLYLVQQKENL